jgi:integrase
MKAKKEKLRVLHRNDDKQAPWVFRFREQVNQNGVLKTVHRSMTLCPASVKRADALKLAEKESARLAQTRPAAPEMMVTLGDYFTRVYLPFAESKLRFATARNYGTMWGKHFASRPHITRKLLCDVRTSDVYGWLGEIVATDKTENGETLGAATVKRLKSLLSGIFTHAVNLGYLQTANPVQGAMLPAAAPPRETIAYSLEQIRAMIAALPDATSRVMVAVAAFTGLSRSEIRGLAWEAWQGDELHVLRSIVGGRVQDTKTRARKAPVPLLPSLAQVLAQYRAGDGNPVTGPIFRTANGTPLDPNNILRDRMQPAFKKAGVAFWQGWHGLRRGLASNLHRLQVQDMVIQRILRHSNVSVTQACYIKTANQDSVRALESLDAVLCPSCALESAKPQTLQLQ